MFETLPFIITALVIVSIISATLGFACMKAGTKKTFSHKAIQTDIEIERQICYKSLKGTCFHLTTTCKHIKNLAHVTAVTETPTTNLPMCGDCAKNR